MNKVVLMGRLTGDPEVRYTQGEMAVGRYTLAVDRRFKRDGEATADFINCVAFGKQAEFAERYFRQGLKVIIPRQNPDWKLHESGGKKGIHHRRCGRRTGFC